VLEALGFERHQARNLALRFRRHNLEQLEESAPHFKDESKLIALSKIGRQQMEQFMAEERQRKASHTHAGGWAGEAPRDGDAPSP
jgi:glutathione-regulated potassium-efflux system ancillary protein KefC